MSFQLIIILIIFIIENIDICARYHSNQVYGLPHLIHIIILQINYGDYLFFPSIFAT